MLKRYLSPLLIGKVYFPNNSLHLCNVEYLFFVRAVVRRMAAITYNRSVSAYSLTTVEAYVLTGYNWT